jgi:glutamate racemase
MNNNRVIGLFDSGIGGTSIWKEIVGLLPFENTVYIADSENAPYGDKTKKQIIERCIVHAEFLIERGSKIIVVACNTATTNAIDYLRSNYNIPFIGIEPAIKPAALNSKTGSVGILATRGTLTSQLFEKTASSYSQNIKKFEQIGEGLVPLIEEGKQDSAQMKSLLNHYLKPMLKHEIDHLVLGCTHYPYLIPQIREIVGNDVNIIDSGEAVARQTQAVLKKLGLLNTSKVLGKHQFYSNGKLVILKQILGKNHLNCSFSKL